MAVAHTAKLTAEDYRRLPDSGPRFQLIEGELYKSPAPNRYHQVISRNLEFLLLKHLEKHPLGELYHAPFDVYLSEHDVFQPDVVFVKKENFDVLTDAGVEGTPDFLVEILSPGNAYLDKKAKLRVYARVGVQELWIVDPETRTVQVYFLQQDAQMPAATYGEQDTFASPHFPGLVISAAEIFKR
jgi:Uma2 family endonuclease